MRNKMEVNDNVDLENPPKSVKYVRRADRRPEKDFDLKTHEGKIQASFNRSAVKRVREKITRLEDEIDKRDKEIDLEKKLRQEAENKLQAQFTDMYNHPGVNQELRARLPRANKSDPFKQEEISETDLSSIEEQIVIEEEEEEDQRVPVSKPRENRNSDCITPEKPVEASKTESGARPKSVQRSLNFSSDTKLSPHANMDTQTEGLDRSHTFPSFTGLSPIPGLYAPGPYTPLHSTSLHGAFQSPYLRNSILSPSLLTGIRPTPLSNTSVGFPTHSGDTEPLMSRSHSANILSSPPTSAATAGNATSLTRERTLPGEVTLNAGAVGGDNLLQSGLDLGARASGPHTFLPSQHSPLLTSILPDSYMPAGSARFPLSSNLSPDQQSRQVAILINELDAQREEVKKIKKMLADRDLENEALKLTLKTKDVENDAKSSEINTAAGIVEEVYAAQKKRDDATTKRMKTATDERDDLIGRLREIEARLDAQSYNSQSLDGYQMDNEQFDLEDIHLQMSPTSVDRPPSSLVHKVESMQERQREVMKEEMQIVTDQRDMALAKCQKLEQELQRYQRERDADGGMDKDLRAKLAAVRQERDMAIAKSQQLDNEIQEIRIYYSLYKSLAGKNTVQQLSNNTATAIPANYAEELRTSQQEVEEAHQEIQRLKEQLEMHTIGKRNQQEVIENITREKERFERLVSVLRKKLKDLENNKEERK